MQLSQKISPFKPRILRSLKNYRIEDFWKDLGAGITVGLVALPLAIAFAIASGVKPEAGLISAVIGGFIISALGGTKVQIGGPAGAFVVILYAILERYGLANLIIASSLAGILLFLMGLFKVGGLIRFIPIGIILGFTSGIGLLICISQAKEAFGLHVEKMPADFFSQLHALWQASHTFNISSFLLFLSTIAFLILWPRFMAILSKKISLPWLAFIPSIVVILVGATLFVKFLGLDVATIGSRFGGIPSNLPKPTLPEFNWESAKLLFAPTITLALLGAIESLLCARVADSMTDDRHDPNQELMAQGVANFITPLFGGLAVTGTIARTATNARAGARSPVAGIIHALTVLAVMLLAAPWASFIPMPTLAGILVFVGANMVEWHEFKRLRHFKLPYRTVFLGTFFLTVIFDLTVAVEVGLILACGFFILRISEVTKIVSLELPTTRHFSSTHGSSADVEAYAIFGSLFFGSVHHLEKLLDPLNSNHPIPKIMILEMHQVISIDTSGVDALQQLSRNLHKKHATLIICSANSQALSILTRSGFIDEIGVANCCPDIESAYDRAQSLLTI
jgi:SulP family sulfate permease